MTDKTKKQKPWYIEYDLIILDIISILLLGYIHLCSNFYHDVKAYNNCFSYGKENNYRQFT